MSFRAAVTLGIVRASQGTKPIRRQVVEGLQGGTTGLVEEETHGVQGDVEENIPRPGGIQATRMGERVGVQK